MRLFKIVFINIGTLMFSGSLFSVQDGDVNLNYAQYDQNGYGSYPDQLENFVQPQDYPNFLRHEKREQNLQKPGNQSALRSVGLSAVSGIAGVGAAAMGANGSDEQEIFQLRKQIDEKNSEIFKKDAELKLKDKELKLKDEKLQSLQSKDQSALQDQQKLKGQLNQADEQMPLLLQKKNSDNQDKIKVSPLRQLKAKLESTLKAKLSTIKDENPEHDESIIYGHLEKYTEELMEPAILERKEKTREVRELKELMRLFEIRKEHFKKNGKDGWNYSFVEMLNSDIESIESSFNDPVDFYAVLEDKLNDANYKIDLLTNDANYKIDLLKQEKQELEFKYQLALQKLKELDDQKKRIEFSDNLKRRNEIEGIMENKQLDKNTIELLEQEKYNLDLRQVKLVMFSSNRQRLNEIEGIMENKQLDKNTRQLLEQEKSYLIQMQMKIHKEVKSIIE